MWVGKMVWKSRDLKLKLPHTPYSPDLPPCDFWPYAYIKSCIRGRRLKTRSAVGNALYQCVNSMPKEHLKDAFLEWIQRL